MSLPEFDRRNDAGVSREAAFAIPETLTPSPDAFTLAPIFQNSMILQGRTACRIWGKAKADGPLCLILCDARGKEETFYGIAINGFFEIMISAHEYGGPYTLKVVSADGKYVEISDILFGEVFLLGGQSNMGWTVGQCYRGDKSHLLYDDIVKNCADDDLREVLVWPRSSESIVDELPNIREWKKIRPDNIGEVSACGYFFAREFRRNYDIPVAIVGCAMGGTNISEWVPGGGYYNAMVYPIRKMTFRSVLWYQGEGDPDFYSQRLVRLIRHWRDLFAAPDLPFAIVQLPRYQNEECYFKCREEDKKAALEAGHATYCVTIDTGLYPENKASDDELNDDGIHPYEKKPVGERLAHAYMADIMGERGILTSPRLCGASSVGGSVLAKFENVGRGLTLEGMAGFELAGPDGAYFDATPELVTPDTVRIFCDEVKSPAKARYGFKNKGKNTPEHPTECKMSVSLYSTRENGETAYPAEQFEIQLSNGGKK